MNLHNVEFLISAARPSDFPGKRLPEIAFAGKSNVGKSSVINRLLNRKNLQESVKSPARRFMSTILPSTKNVTLLIFRDTDMLRFLRQKKIAGES